VYTTTHGYGIESSLSYVRGDQGICHITWRMSDVAGSINGRYHHMWETLQDIECTSRSSGRSCSRTVTQWLCLNECNWRANTQTEKLVNRAWSYCDKPSDQTIPEPLPASTRPMHSTMHNAAWATENRNRQSKLGDGNRWWGYHPSTILRFVIFLCNSRTTLTYAAKRLQLLHHIIQGIQMELCRKSG